MPALNVLGRARTGSKLNLSSRILRRSKVLGKLGQEGSTFDQVAAAAQSGIEALKSLGDTCKLACNFKHIFNKEKRQRCKCLCAQFNPEVFPPPGVDCEAQFGIVISPISTAGIPGTTGVPPTAPAGISTNTLLLVGGAVALALVMGRRRK